MKTFADKAASWTFMHACTQSPWLFCIHDQVPKGPNNLPCFTLVDSITFIFQGMPETEIGCFWKYWDENVKRFENDHVQRLDRKSIDPNNCVVLTLDRTGYDPWLEIFDFEWEPIKVIVHKRTPETLSSVAFEDCLGRRGHTEFRPYNSNNILFDKKESIPWLPLQT
jgi:hypothetical protein